jgi:hypothetical protein
MVFRLVTSVMVVAACGITAVCAPERLWSSKPFLCNGHIDNSPCRIPAIRSALCPISCLGSSAFEAAPILAVRILTAFCRHVGVQSNSSGQAMPSVAQVVLLPAALSAIGGKNNRPFASGLVVKVVGRFCDLAGITSLRSYNRFSHNVNLRRRFAIGQSHAGAYDLRAARFILGKGGTKWRARCQPHT